MSDNPTIQAIKHKVPALETLKNTPQWVCYKSEVKTPGDKPAKMPKNPHTGGNASSTNKETWGTFLDAVRAKKRYQADGLGWVFTKEAGIIGVDLDHCIGEDGQIEQWASDIVQSLNSYTEVSPSGRGLHIFVYGSIPKSLGPTPGGKIEMYSRSRYFTVTGQMLQGSFDKIAHRQGAIDQIWQAEHKRRREEKRIVTKPAPQVKSITSNEKLAKYTEKAYLDEIAMLSMATKGCRNDALNRAAFSIGQFIEAGLLNRTEAETTLLSLACQLGLGEREAWATIQSGINGGINNPRSNWPNDSKPLVDNAKPVPALPKNDLAYYEQVMPHLDFISKRWGLSKDTVDMFKVGYCENCPTSPYSASFTFPYYSNDNLVDIRHRLLTPNGQGRYRPEVEGSPPRPFNIQVAKEDDFVILVNREISAMLLYGEYALPAIGLPSTFRKDWLFGFDRLNKVYIALDPDQSATARKIGKVLSANGLEARICTLPFSPKDMLVKYGCSIGEFGLFIDQAWKV